LVPGEDTTGREAEKRSRAPSTEGPRSDSPESFDSSMIASTGSQHHGDRTTENESHMTSFEQGDTEEGTNPPHEAAYRKEELNRSPGEIAFFKLLHTEFKKATFFFDKAQQEFIIREERVQEGSKIMEQPNSIMVNEKWSLLAKSIYRLYKDLLLFETFAIMTYCSFSKILKKHDKVTGHQTRKAFMANVVNKANFTNYPRVLEMISRCEHLYDGVSNRLLQEGKEGLYEDERLFINMIARLNEQALDTAEGEGAPDRKSGRRSLALPATYPRVQETAAVSTLRSLVEENDLRASAAHVSEGHVGDDSDGDSKRPADEPSSPPSKRKKALK
jgi:hypothetical protein